MICIKKLMPVLRVAILFLMHFSFSAYAQMSPPQADLEVVRDDLRQILKKARLSQDQIDIDRSLLMISSNGENRVTVQCTSRQVRLAIRAQRDEWGPTFYLGLQKLGFLFPHPRIQISPTTERIRAQCGKTFEWKPRLKYRGFHLHTQHPNEWVHGFLMGESEIAHDMIRWLARNGQNTMNIVLLRTLALSELQKNLREPFKFARSLGISTGVSVSFNMQQQKSYRLIDHGYMWNWGGIDDLEATMWIRGSILDLAQAIPFDFMTIELGSSEFTSNQFESTLKWIETASKVIEELKRQVFFKIHVSSNQVSSKYGNYNFLPQYARPSAGIWPHTVMFYGIEDARTPVYGRKNFQDIEEFTQRENQKRQVWYFPETSYFIAMDIDVPLLLTDYLISRSRDFDFLEKNKIPGQINFTTGHELGYWLIDWTVALLVNAENRGKPQIGLELLGEDLDVWKHIVEFQNNYFKKQGLISILSSSTPLDEMPKFGHSVHERVLLKTLADPSQRSILIDQIQLLEKAVRALPPVHRVKNPELRLLLQTTWERVRHALALRVALLAPVESIGRSASIQEAVNIRMQALSFMEQVRKEWNRYPEAMIFSEHSNPTSYGFGYGFTAARLHYWEREEKMILTNNYSPFFMNIYDLLRILF